MEQSIVTNNITRLLKEIEDKIPSLKEILDAKGTNILSRLENLATLSRTLIETKSLSLKEEQVAGLGASLIEAVNLLQSLKQADDAERRLTLIALDKVTDKISYILRGEKIYQQGVSDALSHYNQELMAKIENSSKELDGQVEKINHVREMLQSQFEKTISDLQESVRSELGKFQEESLIIKSDYESAAKENLDKLNTFVINGQEYAHYLGGQALSGFFTKRAEQEKKSALLWTTGTWVFAILTLLAIGIIFYYQLRNITQNQQVDLSLLGTKVLFTATLGLIAKWTSKRANRHLTEESKYHRLAINMKTMDDFVSKLPEDSRNEILTAVALKTFTEVNGNETATDFETASVLDVIKSALPKVEK